MKDFIILCIAVLISVALLVKFGWLIPAAITLCYAFLTIRKDELTILDFIKYAFRYFITAQQYYERKNAKISFLSAFHNKKAAF